MSNIKQTIDLLCKQLNLLLNANLKPEYFRLAKFNKTDENVVQILWHVLNSLTKKSDEKCFVKTVKEHFRGLNYTSPLFYNLPEDMSSGSRELLLAIGYVVSTNLSSLIEDEIKKSPFHPNYEFMHTDLFEKVQLLVPKFEKEADYQNYLLWLRGKIEYFDKMQMEYNNQNKRLLEKLNNPSWKLLDLTMNEILALNHKDYCKEFLSKCDYILEILYLYNLWEKKENVFWQWMGTVLAERSK